MRKTRAFTLVEILTVIAIIAILVGIALGVAKYASNKAHRTKTLAKLRTLEIGLDNCRDDLGYFPLTDGHGIVQLGETFTSGCDKLSDMAANWLLQKGKFRHTQTGRPYVEGYDGGDYVDAWGRPFLYRCDGDANQHNKQSFDLFSAGSDGQIGTDDDITNWQRND